MKISSRGSQGRTVNVRYVELHDLHTYCSKKAAHFINIWNPSFGYRNCNNFSMIVRNIYKTANRTRADSMFVLLSTFDIRVGVLSIAALEVYGHFWDSKDSYYILLYLNRFLLHFLQYTHRSYHYWQTIHYHMAKLIQTHYYCKKIENNSGIPAGYHHWVLLYRYILWPTRNMLWCQLYI